MQSWQCSAKALEKWGQMIYAIETYGDIGNSFVATYVILPFTNPNFETLAPTAKIIGDNPDFNVLNVPKTQPRHNSESTDGFGSYDHRELDQMRSSYKENSMTMSRILHAYNCGRNSLLGKAYISMLSLFSLYKIIFHTTLVHQYPKREQVH